MAFDTATRNKLARMVADARRLVTEEYAKQLQEIYGIQPDGYVEELTKLTHLDDEQKDVAALLRERIEHLASVMKTEKKPVAAAIDRMTREQAFTTLNRFAALRMCEERRLVQECVRKGLQSKGFLVYLKTAGSDLGDHYDRYRAYLFCVFDEIAVDLGVLFDRFSPFGLLFPREPALLELITIINDEELKHIWAEDETIGWIYQYFNTQEERRAMRDASSAPRNSYELAVRNQFFTPRYVVQFLTDNTLGRIWYEMRKGQTSLKEKCQYLVRRPNEIFLKAGEETPEAGDKEEREELSQEQLLRQPVYIPHRAKKDPREIKILDPACGSGHFLLYAFDLLETIYQEAWDDPELGGNLKKDLPSPEDFHKAVPGLILKHNLHGIDIDARCVQIGSLSLWLRAQKAYKEMGLKPIDRPKITKTNIVTAEPMPGENDLLKEFTTKLKTPALGQLVEIVFDKMQLAGEAGSLLMIEEEIRSAVSEAKKLWLQGPKQEQLRLFGDMPRQTQLKLDFSGISDEQFWDQAEERIYSALEAYAEQAENGSDYQRRLFADDAARGFAFIDLCRKRYDVVLMNPPFGEVLSSILREIESRYPTWNRNLLCAFIDRAIVILNEQGFIGSVFDKTAAIKTTYELFRREVLLSNHRLQTQVNLGWGVLDDANVEVAGLIASARSAQSPETFFDIERYAINDKAEILLQAIQGILNSEHFDVVHYSQPSNFLNLPNAAIAFNFPLWLQHLFTSTQSLLKHGCSAFVGHSFKSDRHFRLLWEIAPEEPVSFNTCRFSWLFNGGEYYPFYRPERDVVVYGMNGDAVASDESVTFRSIPLHGVAGIGYGKRGDFIDAQVLSPGHVFTVEGEGAPISCEDDRFYFAALLSSSVFSYGINLYCGQHKYPGYVNIFPSPLPNSDDKHKIINAARTIWNLKRAWGSGNETDIIFIRPLIMNESGSTLAEKINALAEKEASFDREISKAMKQIDENFESIYRLSQDSVSEMQRVINRRPVDKVWIGGPTEKPEKPEKTVYWVADLLSYAIGCLYGRWDIRISFRASIVLPPADLNSQPPRHAYGSLLGTSGRVCLKAPAAYPLSIAWDGILVNDLSFDNGHLDQNDIVCRVRNVFDLLWKDRAHEIEQEACDILNVSDLRDYFYKPTGFFADHLKRYSKSHRQAPVYWPLSSSKGSYTLWIYYHRLTNQTLFTCVTDFVEPKIQEVSKDIDRLQKQLAQKGTPKQREELDKLQDFRQELTEFCDELLRIAKLPYKPNLNDGVIITACPLWKLFRHNKWSKDLKACWEKLEAGKYDWAHLAYSIWPDRVKKKCRTDRSIAIAVDLEQLCEVEPPKKKQTKKRKKRKETEALYDN